MNFMNLYKYFFLKFFLFFYILKLDSFTIVYNLKISQTTRHQSTTNDTEKKFIFSSTFDATFRKRYNCAHETYLTDLTTLIYSPDNFYLRADFAFGSSKFEKDKEFFSKVQTDDFLLYGGISKNFSDNLKVTFSGIVGIPTHSDSFLTNPTQLGTGHFGIGFQTDGSFSYDVEKSSIFAAARYVYFLPRTIDNHTIDPGNAVDFFISHQTKWGNNSIEYGYDLSLGFGASINPPINPEVRDVPNKNSLLRNSFFISYYRSFFIGNNPSGILLGLSYGFDSISRKAVRELLGIKRSVSFWISWGISF